MSAWKYYKYVGVATASAGLGVAVTYAKMRNDTLFPGSSRNSIIAVEAEVEKPSNNYTFTHDFSAAINDSRRELLRAKELSGTPGVSIAVNVDGKTVWSEGVGFSDLENEVPCTAQTVMRIASISKSITMAVLARLWQEGLVDLDKPVQEYVPKFPVLSFEGEKVDITTRMLVSHLSGIRHYRRKETQPNAEKTEDSTSDAESEKKSEELTRKLTEKKARDTEFSEMFLPLRFHSVEDALSIFKDDELFNKPGTKYHYTTYGWTLISAVIEAAADSTFPRIMAEFFNQMGLHNTSLDYNEAIVYHRARFYSRRRRTGRLENSQIVDNSYKWAGGGYLSNVEDLTRFADMMLYCFQQRESDLPGYLNKSTVEELWSVKTETPRSSRGSGYGMGWSVVPQRYEFGWGDKQPMVVSHSGGAVGASSVLLILPRSRVSKKDPPTGVTVAILGNLDNVEWEKTASFIAKRFESVFPSWF